MNKNLLSALSFIVIACFCEAETSLTTNVWSQYVSSHSAVFSGKPVLQNVLVEGLGHGAYASLFHSVGLDDSSLSSNYGDEIDYGLGWTGGKDVVVNVNVAYWDLYKLFKSSTDVYAVNMGISRAIASDPLKGTVGLTLENYIPVDSKVWTRGCRGFAYYSFAKSVTERASLSCRVQLVRDDGALGSTPSFVGGLQMGLNWKVGKVNVTFPQFKQTWVLSKVFDGRKNQLAWGGGTSFSF